MNIDKVKQLKQNSGLWFTTTKNDGPLTLWSKSPLPPTDTKTFICFDGIVVGKQCRPSLELVIYPNERHRIVLRKFFVLDKWGNYQINRVLELDDFEVITNTHYDQTKASNVILCPEESDTII